MNILLELRMNRKSKPIKSLRIQWCVDNWFRNSYIGMEADRVKKCRQEYAKRFKSESGEMICLWYVQYVWLLKYWRKLK